MTVWFILAANGIAFIAQLAWFVGWFRRWLIKQVSEPLTALQQSMVDIKELSQRAHDRLDRHLEVHSG